MINKKKVKVWILRYMPADIFAYIISSIATFIALYFLTNKLTAAYIGTIVNALAFAGFISFRDIKKNKKKHNKKQKKYNLNSFVKDARKLILEFSIGGILVLLIIRPMSLYYFLSNMENIFIATVIGNFVADIFFYTITIISYEFIVARENKEKLTISYE